MRHWLQLEIEKKLRSLLTKEKEKAEVGILQQCRGDHACDSALHPLDPQRERVCAACYAGGGFACDGSVHGRLNAALIAVSAATLKTHRDLMSHLYVTRLWLRQGCAS
jgi:hypothetical protein